MRGYDRCFTGCVKLGSTSTTENLLNIQNAQIAKKRVFTFNNVATINYHCIAKTDKNGS